MLDQLSSTRRVAYPIRAIAYNEKGSEFRGALPRRHQPGTRTGEEHENRCAMWVIHRVMNKDGLTFGSDSGSCKLPAITKSRT